MDTPKPLFDAHELYTPEGNKLAQKFAAALKPIFDEYAKTYRVRDIEKIASYEVTSLSALALLGHHVALSKERRGKDGKVPK